MGSALWIVLAFLLAPGSMLPKAHPAAPPAKPDIGWSQGLHALDQVNPLIGTAGNGETFPSVGVPFGMTGWTPETRSGEQKCISPFYAGDKRILGFRGSHFLSGSCTQDYGSVALMPESGPLALDPAARASTYSQSKAVFHPDYVQLHLDDAGIDVELTGTTRTGFLRFRFTHPGLVHVVVEANSWGHKPFRSAGQPAAQQTADGSIRLDPARGEITGSNAVRRLYAGAGKLAGFRGWFVVRFDHPLVTADSGAKGAQAWAGFQVKAGEVVQARVGTSFTSLEEARRNLDAESPGWAFAAIRSAATRQWAEALGRIQLADADKPYSAANRHIFYTALYHSLLLPRIFSDASGAYPRFADGKQVEQARGFTYYDDFSLFDTFRAVHPLLTLLAPDREADMAQSLVAKGQQGGYLPIFPAWNSYTAEMIGDHGDSLFADAWVKGIRGFDVEAAYRLMRRNAMHSPEGIKGEAALYRDGRGRRALPTYLRYGYVPLEDHVPESFHPNEQVSRTLEYAYDDWCIGELARGLGKTDDARLFAARGENWRHVLDPVTGFARGRHADGSWETPFDPGKPDTSVTEGLPWQYTFFVPQNLPGLVAAVGGQSAFAAKLDGLFAHGYYQHGNEPSHHIAYLYNAAGQPAKTQAHVRDIMDRLYHDAPDGLAGNDDAGQISAWYVFSAMGFYPVTPGSDHYELGIPRFDSMTLFPPVGRPLRIHAEGAEAGRRSVRLVTLNGKPLPGLFITHGQLLAGGDLVFTLSD